MQQGNDRPGRNVLAYTAVDESFQASRCTRHRSIERASGRGIDHVGEGGISLYRVHARVHVLL